jgi:hypothetical protein
VGAACCMPPSGPLDVLAVPLLLLPLLVRRGFATCTGAGTCLLVRLKGAPRLLPARLLPVSKLSIAAKPQQEGWVWQLQLSRKW